MKKKNSITVKNILIGMTLSASMLLSGCGNVEDSAKETSKGTSETIAFTTIKEEPTFEETGDPENSGTNSENTNSNPSVASSINEVSDNLFLQTLLEESDENANVLLSPYSIIMDFGMLENGAKGDTLDEFVKYLNGGLDTNELNNLMKASKEQMMSSEFVSWNIANSIWLNEKYAYSLNEDVEQIVKDYYSSVINQRPYNNDTLNEINKWVNDNTNGMIPTLLSNISPDQVMHLINAVAFEGDWADKFNESAIIKDYEFTNLDGSTSNVDMLSGTLNGYFKSDDFDGFRKAFADENYEFFAIRPSGDLTPKELMKKISDDGKTVSAIMSEYSIDGTAAVKIPKFTLDYDTSLNNILKNMGITTAFSDNADFSALGNVKDLYISDTLHKTHFEISETGVKAAAATVITMKANGILVRDPETPYEITLDKPFIYGIFDKTNNLPIFIGCQNTME